MALESLSDSLKQPLGEQLRDHYLKVLHYDWIFSTLFEKALVAIMFFWSLYSLIKFVWGLF